MRFLRQLLACLLVAPGQGTAANDTVSILADGRVIEAEVAETLDAITAGLMHRSAMPPDHGMLFVFPDDGYHCMWMRNTYLPLSVAFLDTEAQVINIEDMAPLTDDRHCAVRPARYALELHSGWYLRHGIEVGTRLSFRLPDRGR